jgi:hypothetical protein
VSDLLFSKPDIYRFATMLKYRLVVSGDLGDHDVYGVQQHDPCCTPNCKRHRQLLDRGGYKS